MAGSFHEQYERPELPLPPDRSTGLVFAAVALIVAYIWRVNTTTLTISLGLGAVLVIVSFTAPLVLRPLNIAWMRFAILLGRVMNPIIMLVLFAIAIVPTGLIMQIVRDPLRRRKGAADSYWIPMDRSGDTHQSSMKNQF